MIRQRLILSHDVYIYKNPKRRKTMQKRPFRRLIATVLSLVMILSMMPIIPLTAHATAPETYSVITAGETFDVYVSTNETKYYMFMPRVGGTYTFYSSYYDSDPWGYVYDSNMNELEYDDDDGEAWNFSITMRFEAGQMYFLATNLRSGCQGTLTLNLRADSLDEVVEEEPTPEVPEVEAPAGTDVWDGSVSTFFGGGSGTENDPYLIYTAEQLARLAADTNNGATYDDSYFKLMNDLDLAGIEWTPISKGSLITSLNGVSSGFGGNFDGNGKVIYNLAIHSVTSSYVGLFGTLAGDVYDLGIVGVDINVTKSGYSICGGAIAGGMASNSSIRRCFAQDVSIVACTPNSATTLGSIVGFMPSSNTIVENCYGTGNICGTGFSGGICGTQFGANGNLLTKCYFVGTVKNSANTGGSYIPAQAGGISNVMSSPAIISYCFFVGEVINSYGYRGPINGDDRYTPASGCYYNSDSSFNLTHGTYVGTESFQSADWLTSSLGFNFESVWTFNESSEYPVLCGFEYGEPEAPEEPEEPEERVIDVWDGTVGDGFGGGSGTADDPYLIYTAEQLAYLAYYTNSGNTTYGIHFKLMANIDLAGLEWTPIGTSTQTNDVSTAFRGVFDGNHFVVKNVSISNYSSHDVGFFGIIYYATVKNLGVEDIDYTLSSASRMGGFCGAIQKSTIESCYVTGSLELSSSATGGTLGVGGFIGDMYGENCVIKNSYANCDIINRTTGDNVFVGGFAGFVCATGAKSIINCYVTGTIVSNGIVSAGGLVGKLWSGNLYVSGCVSAVLIDGEYKGAIIGSWFNNFAPTYSVENTYYPVGGSNPYGSATETNISNFSSESWLSETLGWDFEDTWAVTDDGEIKLAGFVGSGAAPEQPEDPEIPDDPDDPEEERVFDLWDGTIDYSGFGGGSGTADDPYLIYTAEQLAYLAYMVNNGYSTYSGNYIKLMSDLDMDSISWTPIGNSNYLFMGSFNGNHHTIKNLTLTESLMYVGLFGRTSYATVSDLGLVNVQISATYFDGSWSAVGALIGEATETYVYGCFAETTANVRNGNQLPIGGLIGMFLSGNVSNCYAIANLTVNARTPEVGGLIGTTGWSSSGYVTIENCFAVADIYAYGTSDCYAGGLVGINFNYTNIYNCFVLNTSVDATTSNVGAICGKKYSGTLTLSNCYNAGCTVSGTHSGSTIDAASLADMSFIQSTLGWNGSVWMLEDGAEYPTLTGFDGSNSEQPEQPEDPEIPEDPEDPEIPDDPEDPEEPTVDAWDGTVAGSFGGGQGTAEDPFLIYTAEQLAYLASAVNDGRLPYALHFKLMSDIDLGGHQWTPIGCGHTDGWDFSADYGNYFTGTFDGNGHVIYNLTQTQTSYGRTGLFTLVYNATIKNLALVNVNISITNYAHTYTVAGALIGSCALTNIDNCYVQGTLSFDAHTVSAIGSMVGHIDAGHITNCVADVDIQVINTSNAYVGGFAGIVHSWKGEFVISNCVSACNINVTVSSRYSYVGGFVGISESCDAADYIENCISLVEISATGNSGTYSDPILSVWDRALTTINCYSSTSSSYATLVDVSCFASADWLTTNLGWDLETVWTIGENGLPELRVFGGDYTAPEQPEDPEIPEDPEEPEIPDEERVVDVWDGTIADGFGGGSGTESDPYLIYTAEELAYLAEYANNGYCSSDMYFKLMADLDLAGIEWTPIGKSDTDASTNVAVFRGNFDGNGHVIKNMKLTSSKIIFGGGLFGVTYMANIHDLGLEDVDVRITASERVGAIVGVMTYSTIERCYVTGTFTANGADTLGGIVGDMRTNAYVKNSYAICDMNNLAGGGTVYMGGITGFVCAEGEKYIEKCFANVSFALNGGSTSNIGGIVGGLHWGYLSLTNSFGVAIIDGNRVNPIFGSINASYNTSYYVNNVYYPEDASSNHGTSTAIGNLSSESWLAETLGWDFDGTWEITEDGEIKLTGFAGGTAAPEQPEDPEIPEDPEDPEIPEDPEEPSVPTAKDTWDGTIADGFGGGSGTAEDPYLIYTAEQLAYLAYYINSGNKCAGVYFKLMSNIDLDNINWTPIGIGTTTTNWSTSMSYSFSGTFDGNGYTIYNLKINNPGSSFVGLFGYLERATVCNLAIENASVYNAIRLRSKVGTLAGGASYSTISQCSVVNATVFSEATSDPSAAGGIIGLAAGCTLTNCYAVAAVSGNGHVGGIIGGVYSSGNTVTNCYAIVDLSIINSNGGGTKAMGGILGYTEPSNQFHNCIVVVNFAYAYENVGTLIGNSSVGTVSNCYYAAAGSIHRYQGTSVSAENLTNRGWIESTLGWDFENVWQFKGDDLNPTLRGFNKFVCEEHSYVSTVVDPTCKSEGYTEHVCEICGDSYRDEYTEMLEHSLEFVQTVEPTCEHGGYTEYYCTACGETVILDEIPALPHTPGEWIIVSEAGCESAGIKYTECTICHQMMDNIYIAPHGHNYVSTVTREATCTTPGIITTECTYCHDSYPTYIYSEHRYVMEHFAPTCEADGKNVYTCERCQDSYEEIIPGGHHYEGVVTKVATDTEEGIMTYTCTICQDSYTEVIPMRAAANILLVQDRLPWDESSNANLLNAMTQLGSIDGWDITTTSNLGSMDLSLYNVIFIANDQSSMTYDRLRELNGMLADFASAGGVVIYGACDQGWGGGNISYELPGGVTKNNYYSYRNYIVNSTHNVITGALSDGKKITNELLYGTYSSHAYFTGLPEGATVILSDANGMPTLVEYPLGEGYIILSGLTWEYTYDRDFVDGTSFAKEIYDDLILHAASLSSTCDHAFDMGVEVYPTCSERGYILHTCELCGAQMKDNFTDMIDHTWGDWVTVQEATTEQEGRNERHCTECGELLDYEIIPMIDAPKVSVGGSNYVNVGETLDYYFYVDSSNGIKSILINPIFNTSIFELVSAEWLIGDATVQTFDPETMSAYAAWDYTVYPYEVFKITLRVKAHTYATQTISAEVAIETEYDGEVPTSMLPMFVYVNECQHYYGTYEDMDGIYHLFTCECGEVMLKEHRYDNDCQTECYDCGHVRVAPHSPYYNSYDDETHELICWYCNENLGRFEHKHDVQRYEPDCYSSGYIYYSCECGHCYEEYLEPLEHEYEITYVQEATCQTQGYTEYHCIHCGNYYYDNYTDYADHTFEVNYVQEPTCTSGGYTEYYCVHCYHYEQRDFTDPIAHEYEIGYVQEPTCTSEGYIQYCCIHCNDWYYEYTGTIDHNYVVNYVQEPTCTEGGYTEYYCTSCYHYEQRDFTDPIDHTYGYEYDPDCDHCGYVRYIRGDFDADGDVDSNDAIYLLYYTQLGGENYPLSQSGDVNGDGYVNSDDAVYLVYYTFFGSYEYPLYN